MKNFSRISSEDQLKKLYRTSPFFLLISMCLSFVVAMVLEIIYYGGVVFFKIVAYGAFSYPMGFLFCFLVQSVRFSLGLTGVSEFANNRNLTGFFGLGFSGLITLFETYEMHSIAMHYSKEPAGYYSLVVVLLFIIWIGFVLECRLALNVTSRRKIKKASRSRIQKAVQKEQEDESMTPPLPGLENMRADKRKNIMLLLETCEKLKVEKGTFTKRELSIESGLGERTVGKATIQFPNLFSNYFDNEKQQYTTA